MQKLGDYIVQKQVFPKIESVFKEFDGATFKNLPLRQKMDRVCRELLNLIDQAEGFLLMAALDFVGRIHRKSVLEHFHFNHFELWLNQFSGISAEKSLEIRGKLAGRFVPREMFQVLFPIGMEKMYAGPHFVTAHTSPDLDTTVASFWGWVDAFSARVSKGIHVWNIPGGQGPSQAETELLFFSIFGPDVFEVLAKHRTALSISGIDLVSQEGMVERFLHDSVLDIDPNQRSEAVVLVDEKGGYLGEWRSTDVDRVRSIVNLLNQCLRWYENDLHVKLVALFAEEKLSEQQLQQFFKAMQEMRIEECLPAKEFSAAQRQAVADYLVKVLGVSEGLESSFSLFARALSKHGLSEFEEFGKLSMETSSVFDKTGAVTLDRVQLFSYLMRVISTLEKAIYRVREYVDQLSIALKVKTEVLGLLPHHINYRADLEEMKRKMDHLPYLTVTASDPEGHLYPLGVIHAADLFKSSLGTVTLRDFSNREETKVPSYLEVISVLDHHKSQIVTNSPTTAHISDAQSSNVLVAQISFAISDPFSSGGMSREEIASQIKEVQKNLETAASKRILQRLLKRQLATDRNTPYFVAPEREIIEYLHCLYAILDDTDLLSKVSAVDVQCVAEILNRLKSLISRKEVEIIQLDDLAQDTAFAKKAAARILQNEDMYSLYRKIYLAKEEGVEENLLLASQEKPSNLFADTKVQNGCCRIGQTKLFSKNYLSFDKYVKAIRKKWLSAAQKAHKEHPEIDFHLHMISTISGAEELYHGKSGGYSHQDELWIWIPETEVAIEHLKNFLSHFQTSPAIENNPMEVEFLGHNARDLGQIFKESFFPTPVKISSQENIPIAVLRYRAGSLNSRKSMISPYLPTIL